MNRTSTVLLAGLASLAGLALTSLPSVATASSPRSGNTQTVQLWIRGGTGTYLNLSGKKPWGIGDLTILEQPVYTSPTGSTRIGEGYASITTLSATHYQLHADLDLHRGTIDLGGIEHGDVFTLAVTGGTGTYQGVRGQATIKLLNGSPKQNPSLITLKLER